MGKVFASEPDDRDSDTYISFENTGGDWDMPWEPAAAREMWSIATLYRLGKTYRVHVDDLIAIVRYNQLIAFDALAYRLAEAGYDVYLSDSRLEVYEPIDENELPATEEVARDDPLAHSIEGGCPVCGQFDQHELSCPQPGW